jgi:adenylate cyclase
VTNVIEAAEAFERQFAKTHTGYRLIIEPSDRRIHAVFNGETVADSRRALVMHETRLPLFYYFPRDDVRMDLLERTDHRTYCPFKGNASYWTLNVGEKTAKNVAWSYETPFDEAEMVEGYLAFYWDQIDSWFADDTEITMPPMDIEPAADNPLVPWLVHEAWKAGSSKELVHRLAKALVAEGMPLSRMRLMIQTLNPQLFANAYTWRRETGEVTEFQATHAGTQSSQFRDSPFAVIFNGEGGVRRRLDMPNPKLDYPILKDLVEEGATDYVAMPMRFSDGQINIITMVSHEPGGFSTESLGQLHEVLPNLSRQLEAHAQRASSLSLLQTYLGSGTGERVINGLVKRGDGENIHAVIFFSDLRDSTALAESLRREDYLAALNQYFDGMVGAVIEHGGEVLKFIGDAVLAIFPIDDPDCRHPDACASALAAVRDAERRIAAFNAERQEKGEQPLAVGIALHRGDLTYGNVGSERRLDFTVIGSAVNEASRIEDVSKTLKSPIVVSSAFALSIPGELVSLGRHTLRGLSGKQEIFTLPPAPVA